MCRMEFAVLEDSGVDDHLNAIFVDREESSSGDEGAAGTGTVRMTTSNSQSGKKRQSSTKARRGSRRKFLLMICLFPWTVLPV